MDTAGIFQALALALGLGMLVGMQRERSDNRLAGIRTFPLITILGVIAGVVSAALGGWVYAALGLGVVGMVVMGNVQALHKSEEPHPGVTSEIAILVMYGVGGLLVTGHTAVAVVVGGSVAILLQAKAVLRAFVSRLGDRDVRAIMQFALITLVILPVLPDRAFGPFEVLNPRSIWLMVVLVVGISLAGYVLYRVLGERLGGVVGGVLGGLVSSTATTVGASRRAKVAPASVGTAALVIMLASTVVYVRVLVEVFVAGRAVFAELAVPIAILGVVQLVVAAIAWFRTRHDTVALPEQQNPADLRSALVFGGLYAVVLFAVAAVERLIGPQAILAVAAVSGATDMDAITLSTAGMAASGRLDPGTAWRAIVVATISNMVFKGCVAAVLGGLRLGRIVAIDYGVVVLVAVVLLVAWP